MTTLQEAIEAINKDGFEKIDIDLWPFVKVLITHAERVEDAEATLAIANKEVIRLSEHSAELENKAYDLDNKGMPVLWSERYSDILDEYKHVYAELERLKKQTVSYPSDDNRPDVSNLEFALDWWGNLHYKDGCVFAHEILLSHRETIQKALKQTEWQDISTAPIDREERLLFDGNFVTLGFREWDKHDGYYWVSMTGSEFKPTHWQPLPPAPSIADAKDGGGK